VELIVAFEEHLGFDIPNEDAENNIRTFDDAVYIFSKEL
jgi:acyl carrier protein